MATFGSDDGLTEEDVRNAILSLEGVTEVEILDSEDYPMIPAQDVQVLVRLRIGGPAQRWFYQLAQLSMRDHVLQHEHDKRVAVYERLGQLCYSVTLLTRHGRVSIPGKGLVSVVVGLCDGEVVASRFVNKLGRMNICEMMNYLRCACNDIGRMQDVGVLPQGNHAEDWIIVKYPDHVKPKFSSCVPTNPAAHDHQETMLKFKAALKRMATIVLSLGYFVQVDGDFAEGMGRLANVFNLETNRAFGSKIRTAFELLTTVDNLKDVANFIVDHSLDEVKCRSNSERYANMYLVDPVAAHGPSSPRYN